ncbi:MAG TPA: hypothetical protein VN512_12710 [Clostridia bacterium]|nr:hypothetical protein [Clostridia bacterium]
MEILIIIAIIVAVVVTNLKKQQAAEQRRKADQAKAAFERRAAQEQVPQDQAAMWGTPAYELGAFNGEGSSGGDPFCQGPAGSFSSSEGVGDSEGELGTEGMGDSEGEARPGEGTGGFGSPRLSIVHTIVKAHDAAQPEQTSPAAAFSFDRSAVVQGILYAEILGKPKAFRRS